MIRSKKPTFGHFWTTGVGYPPGAAWEVQTGPRIATEMQKPTVQSDKV